MVTANRSTLEYILQAVRSGGQARFDVERRDVSKEYYRLRELLKAAEVLEEEDRRYQHLAANVRVSIDPERSQLVVMAKKAVTPLDITPSEPDEADALEEFRSGAASEVLTVRFKPSDSFRIDTFQERLESEGWSISVLDYIDKEHIMVTAEKEVDDDSAMKRLGFGGSSPTN